MFRTILFAFLRATVVVLLIFGLFTFAGCSTVHEYGIGGQPALLVLGGNQGDAVNVRSFPRERVIGYRWPPGQALPTAWRLAQGTAAATTGEA